ncbi:hypothetical protein TSUD_26370 [Trifolium subterraneum]|uniref:EF-hand domain-containing protein n=1 Tax=Trifolium subterraneum TaxID=3900 RepID=A0A2Z6PBU4_TRISU|nr:hypothetical protein TSUD_26370 [Trifolium subterraneum]
MAYLPKEVRIVVVGDKSTGKSTLISAMASDSFPATVPPLLKLTRLPSNSFNDSVPLLLIDTPSSVGQQGKLIEELKRADSVVVTYACDDIVSFERVSSHWLPQLQKLELDLRDETRQVSLESLTTDIMNQFKEVVTCIECSAATLYQSVELSDAAIEFLKGVFRLLDTDKDQLLRPAEVDKLFDAAPESPWKDVPYKDAAETTDMGSFSNNYTPTTVERYAANIIELIEGTKKTLILREIPEDEVLVFLSNKDFLAACDIAAFVHDSSDGYSWKKSIDLLEKVVNQGELTGHKFPCLLIAAKDDLTPFPRAVLDSVKAHSYTSEFSISFSTFRYNLAGAAVALVGLTARRARANKNSSS